MQISAGLVAGARMSQPPPCQACGAHVRLLLPCAAPLLCAAGPMLRCSVPWLCCSVQLVQCSAAPTVHAVQPTAGHPPLLPAPLPCMLAMPLASAAADAIHPPPASAGADLPEPLQLHRPPEPSSLRLSPLHGSPPTRSTGLSAIHPPPCSSRRCSCSSLPDEPSYNDVRDTTSANAISHRNTHII